ncbi:MAG: hypothetical protein B7C24_11230 [Bacteroidetes bacterium 4572_77]|nr:MAG: hypothetical protein B7C24_11230 [Bacteroidetes bacterium 4572_77]
METTLRNKWFLLMINGIIALIAGFVFVLVPGDILQTIGFVAGIVILLSGLFLVFGAFSHAKENRNMLFWLIEGLINLTLGIVLMINPEWLAQFIMIIIGLWAMILGLYQLYIGIAQSKNIARNKVLIINGVITTIIGVLILAKPELVAQLTLQILGIVSILLGLIMLYFSYLIKKYEKQIISATEKIKEEGLETENAEIVE